MASPYLTGPRIASPEFEKFVSSTLAKYDSRITVVVAEYNRKLGAIRESLDTLRLHQKEMSVAIADSDKRKADHVHRLANSAIESVKASISAASEDALKGTADQLRSRISQELEKQIREGLVDRVGTMASDSIQRGSEQAGLALRSELSFYCEKLITSSLDGSLKPELFELVKSEMMSPQLREHVSLEVSSALEKTVSQLRQQSTAEIEHLRNTTCTREEVSALIHAAIAQERSIKDRQLEELRDKIEQSELEWRDKFVKAQLQHDERCLALETTFTDKLAHERSIRTQSHHTLQVEILAALATLNSDLSRLRSDLDQYSRNVDAAVAGVDADARSFISSELKKLQDQQVSSEQRHLSTFKAVGENTSSIVNTAVAGIDQKLVALESRLIGTVNSDFERGLAKARALSDLKTAELTRSYARLSEQVHVTSSDTVHADIVRAEEKANAAIARVAQVAADMDDIVKPLMIASRDAPSLGAAVQAWREEIASARSRMDVITRTTDTLRHEYADLSSTTVTSVKLLQREVSGAISAVAEWVKRVRPVDEIQTETDFYGTVVAQDSFASVIKEMLTELKRQRSSTEERLSGDILTLRGDLVRLVQELSISDHLT